MSYSNLQPTIFAEEILRELDRSLVFVDGCDRRYEGSVKKMGDQVKIPAIGRPTINKITLANRNADLADPEILESSSVWLQIDQIDSFNYLVGDIDEQFALPGIKDEYKKVTVQQLKNTLDVFVAKYAQSADIAKVNSSSVVPKKESTEANWIANQIDLGIQKLHENDVPFDEELELIVTPRAYTILKESMILTDTNNSALLTNGKVGRYGNVWVKVSNNVATLNDAGATDLCMLRTKNAISLVNPLLDIEPYRPEKKHADALKGFNLYGGKIVRPKEIVVLNWKYA